MNLKKVLTGSALSLALLVSASPAFAMTPSNSVQEKNTDSTTIQELKTIVQHSNKFTAFIRLNGATWKLIGTYKKGKMYYGVYQKI
ncbi:hypothetical protein P4T23_15075 [Bacillus spizizenii]|uniref:hypothetical protein n=1 Tax=Bacillus spizizenii TaxID=96241 RepID=UPI00077280A2|nr:hypothetical protein [Bacillus spizizenii]KXJ35319.1 hypothetical protein AX282_06235 [Bacillus spizizenii]MED0870323.1 hypothetical protein [Bacillus spizizenii]